MVVMGFILIGSSAVLTFRLHRKLLEIGQDTSYQSISIPIAAVWMVPRTYLKARSKCRWSAWPAYLMWLCVVSGIMLSVAGLFQLKD